MTSAGMVDVVMTVNGGKEISRAVDDSPALIGFETGRYRPPADCSVGFCDWPFTNPDASFEDHLAVVAEECPKYAVAPDVEGEYTLTDVVDRADELNQHAENVIVVPKEVEPGRIPERFVIGYPNQPNFGSNGNWWRQSYPSDREVHLLGGSPDEQLDAADYLSVGSIDGANVTRYAEFGRVWTPGRQLERPDLTYYERIRESLANVYAMWNQDRDGYTDSVTPPTDDAPTTAGEEA